MKLKITLLSIVTIIALSSCKKEVISRTENIAALNPVNIDINAGLWKPILLTSSTEFAVAAPSATNVPGYTAEINEIKSWQQNMSNEQKEQIKYWGAGAVLRWNEIIRELVAKYNLPPLQNTDGTYPIPDANNPLAVTKFPFANPPYAARAYAYISAAQYDGLVAAWHYKKVYNRLAPYKINTTVNTMLPQTDLPSYPSEDAVVIGVMAEMLKLLFPGEQSYIQNMAVQHRNARIAAGMNVRSDMEAGEALGKAVAQKFVTRARARALGVQ